MARNTGINLLLLFTDGKINQGIVLDDFKDDRAEEEGVAIEDGEEEQGEEKEEVVMSHREMTEICMDKMDGNAKQENMPLTFAEADVAYWPQRK